MKFRINGNKMKKNIESVLMKGKWNSGTSHKSMSLQSNIVISVGDESYLFNGDNYTYVRVKLELDDYDETEKGRVTVDSDTLIKYLTDETIEVSVEDNVLKLDTIHKSVKIPILERHENNDSIIRTGKNYIIQTDMEKEISITPNTTLNTRIKLSSAELVEAMKSCESVGNSIFQLEFDGEMLTVSSSRDTEEVIVSIEPIEFIGKETTMDVSAPFFKHLDSVTTILSFNDDAPLSVISGGFVMLRAPRIQR